ncbi:flagellar hook assembly protein FlgD [Neobacillus muris]|uniref:flagellar hook assembly protein FlgD n=1 Tax=Neobacillus muris TaxID=2941334 RepID=UPI00203DF07A|nr:flagellar hook assembly protein FlgD [Neobacillus muris]
MAMWTDISTVGQNSSIFTNTKSFEEKSNLGKDEFLKILITQLSNQDPSSPLQDKDFIAQMATFSSLEQMTNLNTSFSKFANNQMGQYAAAIGKQVTWTPANSSISQSGVITGISTQNGSYFYLVGNEKVPMENVTEIKLAATDSTNSANQA